MFAGIRNAMRRPFPGLFILPIIAFSAAIFFADFREEIRRSEELTHAVARAGNEGVSGTLRTVDLLLQVVAERAATSDPDNDHALAQALSIQALSMPDIDLLFVTDEVGRRRVASDIVPLFPDVRDRDFFTVQRGIFNSRQVVIDGPLREGDSMRIVVSRPIIDGTNRFMGVVAAVLRPQFFSTPLSQIAPTKVATTTLFNSNGVILARTPEEERWLGVSFMETALFRGLAVKGGTGIWHTGGEGDGIDQVMAWRSADKYPLIVTAGIARESVLSTWWSATVPKLVLEGLLLLLLAYASRLLRRHETNLERTAQDLRLLNQSLEDRVTERTRTLADEIDERRRMECELFEAKEIAEAASQAKSRFLAVASHDLRQPVQALNLYANVLSRRDMGPNETEIVERVRHSALSVATLLDSLLDISKLDAGVVKPQIGPVPLREVLDSLWRDLCPVAEEAGVSLSVVVTDRWALSDPALLRRILQNLVSNAVRYTPTGGKLLVGCRRKGTCALLQVWDTGVGIPPDKHSEIFEEFTQLTPSGDIRPQGLGLGLAIVRRLSLLLGHELNVRSEPGNGSVFQVRLPLTVGVADKVKASESHGLLCAGSYVLVIEDEPDVRNGMALQLTDWGLTPIVANGESAAIELCTEHRIDGIIADFRLHGSVSGIRLARKVITLIGRTVPVVLLTGDTEAEQLREATSSGFHLLHKPISPTGLRNALLGHSA